MPAGFLSAWVVADGGGEMAYEFALFFSIAVYLVVNAFYVRSGLLSLYHPFFYYSLFHGIVFVIRPVLAHTRQYYKIYSDYGFSPSVDTKVIVLLAASLGLVCFYLTSTRAGNAPMVFKSDAVRATERNMFVRTLPAVALICAPLGLYSLYYGFSIAVNDNASMVMTSQGITINTTSNGYISEGQRLLVPLCAIFAWFFRFRWYSFLPLAMFVLFKATSGGRGSFVLAIVLTGLFYFYDKRIKMPTFKVAVVAGLALSLFAAIGQDRGYGLREALGFENQGVSYASDNASRLLEGMDFANMEYFEYVVHVVPQRSGTYDYFLSNLQVLTEPIPRVLWPGKPVGAPIKTVLWFDYGTPYGFTMSMPGVGWYELGWLGVIIWCGLCGWGLGAFYNWFAKGEQSVFSVTLYLTSLTSLIIAYRDGLLLTFLRGELFYLAPILVMLAVGRYVYDIPTLRQIGQSMLMQYRAMLRRQAEAQPAE